MTSPHSGSTSLKVLFATPECAPLAKTGGLGDVSAALPAALRAAGVDVRVLLPGYPAVLDAAPDAAELARVEILDRPLRLLESRLPSGVALLVADCPELYLRNGGPYQAGDGTDWRDNVLRFGVLSKLAALLGARASPLAWRPDVVHCNDWPTALAPVYLHFDPAPHAASVITVHNLAFQGVFDFAQVMKLALPPASFGLEGIEFYGRASFLKGALAYADAITTVSPNYAREIQAAELGFGLDGLLRLRADRLHGVLNGIDTEAWDPAGDLAIAHRYGPDSLDGKAANTRWLRDRVGLAQAPERALVGMVTRLTQQKGIDLVADAADDLLAMGAQVVVVGTGERELVEALRAAEARHPGQFAVFIGFDETLAHLVEAGADIFLMPSRFEPCGMNQMYSQRYGTPPVANATGGLVDTIVDADGQRTGFLMKEPTAAQLVAAMRRAIACWRDPQQWRAIQLNGMAKDFGWTHAAQSYRDIYGKISGVRVNLTDPPDGARKLS